MEITLSRGLILELVILFVICCLLYWLIIWAGKENDNYERYRKGVIMVGGLFCAIIIALSIELINYDKDRGTAIMPDDLKQGISFVVKEPTNSKNSYLIIRSAGKMVVRLLNANKNKILLSLKKNDVFTRTDKGIEKTSP
ncbi:hypothetical protein KAR28_03775 [Candidatus Parcubacteria bacterium]|nr:hypothetical protein [Candidatus Parcubacteria bacterium]